jgi:hypothetical protein
LVIGLLILHSLVGVALLGAITHQAIAMMRNRQARNDSFINRYTGVNTKAFTVAIAGLYVGQLLLGALIYPAYRLNVRVPFEEMSLGWAIGIFELEEHFAAIGLGILPAYIFAWRTAPQSPSSWGRPSITLLLALIVWWNFLVGHVLNNIRGLR